MSAAALPAGAVHLLTPELPVTLAELRASICSACIVDISHGACAGIGCGSSRRYSWELSWIVNAGEIGDAGHVSDLVRLDGFGRWSVCRRGAWNARARAYGSTAPREGRLPNRRGLSAFRDYAQARVATWHAYRCGPFTSYKQTPWN